MFFYAAPCWQVWFEQPRTTCRTTCQRAWPGRTIVFLGGARAPTLETVWGLDGEGK